MKKDINLEYKKMLLCSDCLNSEEIEYKFSGQVEFDTNNLSEFGVVEIDISEPIFYVDIAECKKCNSGDIIIIDPILIDCIKKLNLKGYFTNYSCDGHIKFNEDNDPVYISYPYISFLNLELDKSIFDSLPKCWELDSFPYEDTQYCAYTIYCKDIDTFSDNLSYKEELEKWIESLPKLIEEDEYRHKKGEMIKRYSELEI